MSREATVQILRFYAYFQQTIYESPLEHYRVRPVILYYYLEDDTMAIYEMPYRNSALVQVKFDRAINPLYSSIKGLRVRRHRILKNDSNETYNWRDLNLGQNFIVFGIAYRLCDCDQFTRVHHHSMDVRTIVAASRSG